MIALDTNVLLRALVDDPDAPAQCAAARTRIRRETEAFVPQIVQAELAWALTGAYGLAKPELLGVLRHLQDNTAYRLEHHQRYARAVADYAEGAADFADYLLLASARETGARLLTYDKRLARTPDVMKLDAG